MCNYTNWSVKPMLDYLDLIDPLEIIINESMIMGQKSRVHCNIKSESIQKDDTSQASRVLSLEVKLLITLLSYMAPNKCTCNCET